MGSLVRRSADEVQRLLRERGLVCTAQRELVARTVMELGSHVGAEELHRRLAGKNPRVGLATVYRTLQLLRDNGLIAERQFGERWRRYENTGGSHHDHLVCLGCGAVIEFSEPLIEKLQDKVARRHGFSPERHRLELYGYCRACARERRR
jgi:Fur family ferric uptake transcriptional regulator